MRRAMPPKPTSCFSQSSRLTFASGGETVFELPALQAVEDRVAHRLRQLLPRRVERERAAPWRGVYMMRPSQVSGLYLKASFTKQPPRMLRFGSGTSSSG